MSRRLLAEWLGSLLLAAAVVGSGIMAERLASGNAALALLANTGATALALAALIATLGPVSGAHFNPAVSLVAALRRELRPSEAAAFAAIQVLGCCAGAVLANLMFELPAIEASTRIRTGQGQWLSESVATTGLVLVVFTSPSARQAAWRVAAWIGAAYWFTASTSFANPALTIARTLSDSFSGIRPADVPAFIAAQSAGTLAGFLLSRLLRGVKGGLPA